MQLTLALMIIVCVLILVNFTIPAKLQEILDFIAHKLIRIYLKTILN